MRTLDALLAGVVLLGVGCPSASDSTDTPAESTKTPAALAESTQTPEAPAESTQAPAAPAESSQTS